MKTNKHGQIILDESDLCDAVMRGQEIRQFGQALVDNSVDLETAAQILEDVPAFVRYNELVDQMTTEEFDRRNQHVWFMPEQYQSLDIAQHALNLCESDQELQRVGQELLMYQERNLFDLLRYLKYLVDVMTEHRLVWGVGRGSSVASYVLYKLGVHRIDSLYYDLDPAEFLR
jgi:DNA polymerase III alpha subunit